jgi:predicted DsbA family dithiol-disulfide isomerase
MHDPAGIACGCSGVEPLVRIDLWSDVICPWCYLGNRRLELALADHPLRDQVEVYWHSYELDPDAPLSDSRAMSEIIAKKYGISIDEALAGQRRLTDLAAEVGLEYHLERTRRANTFDAHRLLHLARERGCQAAVSKALFAAYFTDGRLISDRDELVAITTSAGLDADEVALALHSGAFTEHVRRDEQAALDLGVTGVPFFLFQMKYGLAGAQAPEALSKVIDRLGAEEGAAPPSEP